MKLVAHTIAGSRAAMVAARPASGRVRADQPWLCGAPSSGLSDAMTYVNTEIKFHHRWPRDLSP